MLHNKEHYKSLKYNGYEWYAFDEGLHHFQKKNDEGKYISISCNEEMLNNGDIVFMAQHDLSFTRKQKQ